MRSRSRDGLETHQRIVWVSAICVSWIKGTEYCTNFLSLSEQRVNAWSRLRVIAPYKLILYIIVIIIIIAVVVNGRENKVTTAIIITYRPRLILMSRWRLVTYRRLVSVSSRSRALTSRAHPCMLYVYTADRMSLGYCWWINWACTIQGVKITSAIATCSNSNDWLSDTYVINGMHLPTLANVHANSVRRTSVLSVYPSVALSTSIMCRRQTRTTAASRPSCGSLH